MQKYVRVVVLVFISFFSFSFLPTLVRAGITHPYTVDEKPRVLFGDSWVGETHYGLENYTEDYVGGYIHITFTYTHHICCFASYPPLIYN